MTSSRPSLGPVVRKGPEPKKQEPKLEEPKKQEPKRRAMFGVEE
jgi:hypothetical protein